MEIFWIIFLYLVCMSVVKANRCESLSPYLSTACCFDDSLFGCNGLLEFPRFLSTFQRTATSLIILSWVFCCCNSRTPLRMCCFSLSRISLLQYIVYVILARYWTWEWKLSGQLPFFPVTTHINIFFKFSSHHLRVCL